MKFGGDNSKRPPRFAQSPNGSVDIPPWKVIISKEWFRLELFGKRVFATESYI
jgi:hypothetical protein